MDRNVGGSAASARADGSDWEKTASDILVECEALQDDIDQTEKTLEGKRAALSEKVGQHKKALKEAERIATKKVLRDRESARLFEKNLRIAQETARISEAELARIKKAQSPELKKEELLNQGDRQGGQGSGGATRKRDPATPRVVDARSAAGGGGGASTPLVPDHGRHSISGAPGGDAHDRNRASSSPSEPSDVAKRLRSTTPSKTPSIRHGANVRFFLRLKGWHFSTGWWLQSPSSGEKYDTTDGHQQLIEVLQADADLTKEFESWMAEQRWTYLTTVGGWAIIHAEGSPAVVCPKDGRRFERDQLKSFMDRSEAKNVVEAFTKWQRSVENAKF